jgi:MFS family permease
VVSAPLLTRVRPADLRKLRSGQTVSMFGDAVTMVALPSVALLVAHATPFEYGLLSAATYIPYPFLGLQAGAWVDRMRRRKVMVIADVTRFAAIVSIPLAAFSSGLSITHLFVAGLIVGVASVFFNAAYQAYLPSIVGKDQITAANAKLSVGETSSQVGGPPLAGFLISAFGAAPALLLDALSFLASSTSLMFIRRAEVDPRAAQEVVPLAHPAVRRARRRARRNSAQRKDLKREILQGLQVVFRDRLILGLTLTAALSNLGRGMCLELFLLFAYSGLHLSPALASSVLAIGNVGSLLGALTCERFTKAVGIGAALRIASLMKGLPWVLAPLTLIGPPLPISVVLILVSSYFVPISLVTNTSIRQSLVSRELQGRVASTSRTITSSMIPLSAILGGALGEVGIRLLGPQAGLSVVLAIGGALWMSATVLLPRKRLEKLKTISDLEHAEQHTADAPARQEAAGAPARQEAAGAPARQEAAGAPARQEAAEAQARQEAAGAPARQEAAEAQARQEAAEAQARRDAVRAYEQAGARLVAEALAGRAPNGSGISVPQFPKRPSPYTPPPAAPPVPVWSQQEVPSQ